MAFDNSAAATGIFTTAELGSNVRNSFYKINWNETEENILQNILNQHGVIDSDIDDQLLNQITEIMGYFPRKI